MKVESASAKRSTFHRRAGFLSAALLLFAVALCAQQPTRRAQSQALRETVLQGTVLRYDSEPLSARLVLQTTEGTINVDLGAPGFLAANHFTIAAGEKLTVAGASSDTRHGKLFLARLIQKGDQLLAVRTALGAPLAPAGARAWPSQTPRQGGAR